MCEIIKTIRFFNLFLIFVLLFYSYQQDSQIGRIFQRIHPTLRIKMGLSDACNVLVTWLDGLLLDRL